VTGALSFPVRILLLEINSILPTSSIPVFPPARFPPILVYPNTPEAIVPAGNTTFIEPESNLILSGDTPSLNGKLSAIDTAMGYQKDNISNSANKIESISNDVSLLRERVLNDFSLFHGEIKSLSDRFDMFLEFYRRDQ
jgi:hypothetical protein